MAEDYVNLLCLHAIPKAMSLTEVQEATKADPTLCEVIDVIQSGKWYEKSDATKLFSKVKNELTVNEESNMRQQNSNTNLAPTEINRPCP